MPSTTWPSHRNALVVGGAAGIGDIAHHGTASRFAGAGATGLYLAGGVEKDFVLQDLLDHDGHLCGNYGNQRTWRGPHRFLKLRTNGGVRD